MTRKKTIRLLSLVPIVHFLLFIIFSEYLYPIYAGLGSYDKDPAYVYLLNGLTILNYHIPEHFHHPGTPLQILVALEIIMQWFFTNLLTNSSGGLIESVLENPEKYIFNINVCLEIMAALAMFYGGKQIYIKTNSLKKALFVQFATFASVVIVLRIAYLGPESILYTISMLLIGLTAHFILKTKEVENRKGYATEGMKIPVLVGFLCALGIVVKVTFLPVCLIIFAFERKKIYFAVLTFLISILFLLIPLYKKIDQLISWLNGIAVYSGQYGTGRMDFVNVDVFFTNLLSLFFEFKFFYCILIIGLVTLLWKILNELMLNKKEITAFNFFKQNKYFVLILCIMIFQTIIVAKHYEPRYMIPSLMFAPILTIILAEEFNPPHLVYTSFIKKIFIALVVFLAAISAINFGNVFSQFLNERIRAKNIEIAISAEIKKYPNSVVIGTYTCSLEVCAISFGSDYAQNLKKYVNSRLQNFLFFNIWNGQLSVDGVFSTSLEVVDRAISEKRDVFLVGSPDPSYAAFTLELVLEFPGQNLYRVIKGNR